MPKVTAKPNERFDSLLRRFKKAVDKADTMKDLRKYEFYEKPSEVRKRNKAAAKKRSYRQRMESEMRTFVPVEEPQQQQDNIHNNVKVSSFTSPFPRKFFYETPNNAKLALFRLP